MKHSSPAEWLQCTRSDLGLLLWVLLQSFCLLWQLQVFAKHTHHVNPPPSCCSAAVWHVSIVQAACFGVAVCVWEWAPCSGRRPRAASGLTGTRKKLSTPLFCFFWNVLCVVSAFQRLLFTVVYPSAPEFQHLPPRLFSASFVLMEVISGLCMTASCSFIVSWFRHFKKIKKGGNCVQLLFVLWTETLKPPWLNCICWIHLSRRKLQSPIAEINYTASWFCCATRKWLDVISVLFLPWWIENLNYYECQY